MADSDPKSPGPFDLRTIKQLVSLMSQHDLTEINLQEGDLRIRLRRGPQGMPLPAAAVAMPVVPSPAAPVPSASGAAPAATDSPPPAPAKKLIEIKSPTPGTFYASPSPDAEPFVKVGSRVKPDTVVCLIEAMKVYNDIKAECTGVIAEVLVQNQQPVEYGQVLFRVDPSG